MLYNKKLEIVEENTRLESKNVKKFMATFFEHCLKWKYQPERWKQLGQQLLLIIAFM